MRSIGREIMEGGYEGGRENGEIEGAERSEIWGKKGS
jgi:hypothetical protein